MKRENEASIPRPLQDLLRKEPPEKRRRLERIWNELPEAGSEDDVRPDVDEAWSELSRRLENGTAERAGTGLPKHADEEQSHVEPTPLRRLDRRPQPSSEQRRRRDVLRRRMGTAIAAALTVLLIVTGLWILNRPVVIEAGAGEQETVQLPDGSVVELNSGTEIQIASTFRSTFFSRSDRRRVELDGEAYFRVAEDARPFVVETRDAELRVLGTEFNVRARTAAEGTKITLVTGAVVVAPRGGTESVTLDEPGAAASVSPAAQLSVSAADESPSLEHVLAWRHRGFAFIDTPIGVILNEVERRFGLELEPRTGVDVEERINLFYSRGVTPQQILHDICFEQNCRYRQTTRGYALTPDRPAAP